ncbi:AraC family transcriptional regulator [Paenibacillus daejeonensis]|uniref:AraC family transcriptional regulator n=1 Tax=Paenibacillus daejeonensis TaxID=135193 RepID=UPI00036E791D|nr:AraC family transcriptional regulator [Paenibacillus daejeonensis]
MSGQQDGFSSELARHIGAHTEADGTYVTSCPDLSFIRSSTISAPVHTVYRPSICIVAQGRKQVTLGAEHFYYHPGSFLAASVHLPITGQVIEASPETPYLSLQLQFELEQILDVMQAAPSRAITKSAVPRGLGVSPMIDPLGDSVLRLVRLLETPEDLPVLAPFIIREILYRMLQSEQGNAIRHFALMGSQAGRIAHVLAWLSRHYKQPIRVDELAEEAHMSPSSFFACFKEVTAMTPIQYQKQLRLQEARRLLLSEAMDATSAAYQVGYESATQFNREYARFFGKPPMRDIRQFRETILPT